MNSLDLRKLIRQQYAWPGGYEILLHTSDGATLCTDCARENYYQIAYSRRHKIDDGWRVDAMSTADWCDEPLCCDHCSRELSPYHQREEA